MRLTAILISLCKCITELTDSDIPKLYTDVHCILIYHQNRPHSQILQEYQQVIDEVVNDTINYSIIEAHNTEILSILEVKVLPIIKYLENGRVYSMNKRMDLPNMIKFVKNPYKNHWFNYLPDNYSKWTKWQIEWYIMAFEYYVFHIK